MKWLNKRTAAAIFTFAIGGSAFWFRLPYAPLRKEFSLDIAALKARQPERAEVPMRTELETLPDILQRYLIHCGYLGAPKMRWMTMRYKDVAFLQSVNGPALTIDYLQLNTAAEPARLALVESHLYGVPFQGYDYYQDGIGGMKGVVAKHITLFDQCGPEMDRSGLVTYLAEAFLLPSALLSEDIHFEAIGTYQLRATLTAYGQTVSGIFTFNDDAEMIRFTTDDRSLTGDDGTMTKTPWTASCGDYQRSASGYLQPTTFRATWHLPESDFTYFDGKITAITYDD